MDFEFSQVGSHIVCLRVTLLSTRQRISIIRRLQQWQRKAFRIIDCVESSRNVDSEPCEYTIHHVT